MASVEGPAGFGAVPDWADAASRRRETGHGLASARGLQQLVSTRALVVCFGPRRIGSFNPVRNRGEVFF